MNLIRKINNKWRATKLKNNFGEVVEISGKDYGQDLTKAERTCG